VFSLSETVYRTVNSGVNATLGDKVAAPVLSRRRDGKPNRNQGIEFTIED
jgi:hypothetical protein